jgi:predicted nucleic acid-binding protein
MGALTVPESGIVYFDTSVLIYSVETHAAYWPLLQPFWEAARSGIIGIGISELGILETLVGPLRSNDARLVTAYEEVFQATEVRPMRVSGEVLREAARLRATYPSLRTPDAIHAATALLNGCEMFLSNDTGYRQITGLPVALLDEHRGGDPTP